MKTVKRAISNYLKELRKTASARKFATQESCFELFKYYLERYPDLQTMEDFHGGVIEGFLSWWYIRKVSGSTTEVMNCLRTLKQFAKWLDAKTGTSLNLEYKPMFKELSQDLPRVFKVLDALNNYERSRRMMSEMPEVAREIKRKGLKGSDLVDVEPFDPDSIDYDRMEEGYFEVTAIREEGVEVRSMDERFTAFPVKFPPEAGKWLKVGYTINLEIAPHKKAHWEILGHGFVYPGTNY